MTLATPRLVATAAVGAIAAVALACAGCFSRGLMPQEQYAATPPDIVPEADRNTGSIYQSGHEVPLFENSVARRVGDVLTITLEEKTDATKSASTNTAKANKLALTAPTLLGAPLTVNGRSVLQNSLDNSSSFDGKGDSTQSNALTGNISVTVAKRLANGNLLVRGQKWILINQGREYVRIQGIVRPIDITPGNTVPSFKVADASISYGSQGVLQDANAKSWLARFFDSKWFPF